MSDLSDEDKRLAEEMRARQRARREHIATHGVPPEGKIATEPGDAAKHADAIGLDDSGKPFPLTPTLYRDDAHGFSVALPGGSERQAAGDADAGFRILGGAFRLEIRVSAGAASEVSARARALIGDAPIERTFRQPGVTAAAMGSRLDGSELCDVDVLGGATAVATLVLRHDASRVDPATAATVRGTIVASAGFGAAADRDLSSLVPDSPWLEPGLPLHLRADRPAVPAVANRAVLAGELLGALGPLPPASTLRSDARSAIEQVLETAFGSAFESVAEQLTTAHDVRGLALAILLG